MTKEQAIEEVFIELARARTLHPDWPDDVVHQAAILIEEAGSVIKASLDFYYHRDRDRKKLKKEIIHTTAMGLRFLLNLDD